VTWGEAGVCGAGTAGSGPSAGAIAPSTVPTGDRRRVSAAGVEIDHPPGPKTPARCVEQRGEGARPARLRRRPGSVGCWSIADRRRVPTAELEVARQLGRPTAGPVSVSRRRPRRPGAGCRRSSTRRPFP